MNCVDSVFITAVPSGELLGSQADDLVGDHKPLGLSSSSSAVGEAAASSAMATTAPPGSASTAHEQEQQHQQQQQQQQQGRQCPIGNDGAALIASNPHLKPATSAPAVLSPNTVLVNVAGTRYSVGE